MPHEQRIGRAQPQRLHHRLLRFCVLAGLLQRPRHDVVAIDVFPIAQLILRFLQHIVNLHAVIEQIQTPRTMIRARLHADRDFERVEVFV